MHTGAKKTTKVDAYQSPPLKCCRRRRKIKPTSEKGHNDHLFEPLSRERGHHTGVQPKWSRFRTPVFNPSNVSL